MKERLTHDLDILQKRVTDAHSRVQTMLAFEDADPSVALRLKLVRGLLEHTLRILRAAEAELYPRPLTQENVTELAIGVAKHARNSASSQRDRERYEEERWEQARIQRELK